jgi:hypothetical protein
MWKLYSVRDYRYDTCIEIEHVRVHTVQTKHTKQDTMTQCPYYYTCNTFNELQAVAGISRVLIPLYWTHHNTPMLTSSLPKRTMKRLRSRILVLNRIQCLCHCPPRNYTLTHNQVVTSHCLLHHHHQSRF